MKLRDNYLYRVFEYTSDSYEDSEILSQLCRTPEALTFCYRNFTQFWVQLFSLYFAFNCFIFWYGFELGILFVFILGILLTGTVFYFQKMGIYCLSYYASQKHVLTKYGDVLKNCETIVSFQTKEEEIDNLHDDEIKQNEVRVDAYSHAAIAKFLLIVLTACAVIGLTYFLYKKVLQKKLENWKFITFVTIMIFFIFHVTAMFLDFYIQVYFVGVTNDMVEMHDKFPLVSEKRNEQNLENFDLSLTNVNFSYKDNKILNNLSLQIPFGKSLLIKGPIGSGKSTIARLIMRWYAPADASSITLGKIPLENISKKDLHKTLYYMTQNTNLFSDKTILENIFYQQKVDLERLRQLKLPETFTKNFHKKVLQSGINISGGTKRLVHVLRCFFHSAKIIIMDEPTDSLDKKTTEAVVQLIRLLQKEKTVICISHDSRLDHVFQRVYHHQ